MAKHIHDWIYIARIDYHHTLIKLEDWGVTYKELYQCKKCKDIRVESKHE